MEVFRSRLDNAGIAIEVNGKVTVYDTLEHQISGFSQQQSRGASLTFASQHGLIAVANLPVVSVGGIPQPAHRCAGRNQCRLPGF